MQEEVNLLEENELVSRKPCGSVLKLYYGLGHVYNDLCAAVWFSYTLFYFQIVLQMESTTAGTLIVIGQIADSLATPVVGWAVDRNKTPRVCHAAGTAIVATGFSLVFLSNPGPNHLWNLLYYGSLVILFQIGWAVVQISHLSVISAIALDHSESADLTAIRYIASVCCNIFVYLLTWIILKNGDNENIGPDDFYKFRELVLIISGVGIICSIIFCYGIKPKSDKSEIVENGTTEPKETSDNNFFLKSFTTYLVSLMYMSSRLFTILNLIYVPFYLEERYINNEKDDVNIRSAIASVPLASFCASFLTSIVLKYRTTQFTDKITYLLGSGFFLAGSIWIAFGTSLEGYLQIYIIVCLTGIGSSATMVSSLCLTAQFVRANGFGGGSIYSTVTFTDKLISGAVVLLIQHLRCESIDLCPKFYEHVLAYGGGSAAMLGLLSLLFLNSQKSNLKIVQVAPSIRK